MIEKLAETMAEAAGWEWALLGEAQDSYRKLARAVLTRLREPTPVMKEAGTYQREIEGAHAGAIWRAMIDAAMQGPKSEKPPTP